MKVKRKAWVEDLPVTIPLPGDPSHYRTFRRISIQGEEVGIHFPESKPLDNGEQYFYNDKEALREAVKNIEAAGWQIVISRKVPRLATFTQKEMTVGTGTFDVEREM